MSALHGTSDLRSEPRLSGSSPDAGATDIRALESFVLDNPELEQLESLAAGFNLFEAIGAVRREERHSDFLAYLLDPTALHGFGVAVLRGLVDAVLSANPATPAQLGRVDAALMDLESAQVEREWSGVDVLAYSEPDHFVLLIENKIDSVEHSNQLARYLQSVTGRFPGFRILPILLSPDGIRPSDETFLAADYGQVHEVLSRTLRSRRSSIAPDVETVVRHYLEMVERHIMQDSETARLAKKIYEKHSKALGILFEFRPDAQQELMTAFAEVVGADPSVRVVYSSKSCIDFVPKIWDKADGLRDGGDGTWYKTRELVRFEIIYDAGISIRLYIGPGPADLRQKLFDETRTPSNKSLFRSVSPTLYQRKWTQVWRDTVFTAGQAEESDLNAKLERIKRWWEAFRQEKMSPLTEAIAKAPL